MKDSDAKGREWRSRLVLFAVLAGWTVPARAQFLSSEPPQMRGDTAATGNGWVTTPVLTVGETTPGGTDVNQVNLGYRLPGVLDGLGAFMLDANTVRLYVNHEIQAGSAYDYALSNGTLLDGSRISYADLDRSTRQALGGGVATLAIHDRAGNIVTSTSQFDYGGLARLCSGTLHEAEAFGAGRGFADRLYLTGEEASSSFGGPGGTMWVLDVATGDLFGLPDLGRGAWENAALLDTGRIDQIALLLGDDHGSSASTLNTNPPPPLYMYVGTKNAAGTFVERNGLSGGALFVWKTDGGDTNPQTFNGTGSSRVGRWVAMSNNFDAANAGMNVDGNTNTGDTTAGGIDYTADGYAVDSTLRIEAVALGACQFSRPEDLATDPLDGSRAVMASTGRSSIFGGVDRWGTVYLVDVDFAFLGDGSFDPSGSQTALTILHDGDAAPNPQLTLRNPDNVEWSERGVFVQEDDTSGFSGIEASVWELPLAGGPERMLEMDRSAVPFGQTDTDPNDVGDWESSGVVDVTDLFDTASTETLLLLTVQAHHVRNGGVGGSTDLVEGGQLLFASKVQEPGVASCFGVGCPCGNDSASTSGCVNSTGSGAALAGSGSTSVLADDLVLTTTDCPPNNSGLYFMGGVVFAPVFVGDGLACTGGILRYFPSTVDGSGVFALTTPVANAFPGAISPGDTRHFQSWTRDVLCGPPPMPCPTPCGNGSNLSNAYTVTFLP